MREGLGQGEGKECVWQRAVSIKLWRPQQVLVANRVLGAWQAPPQTIGGP